MTRIVDTDYLVIGSGISGLYSALILSEFGKVTIITKEEVTDANTTYAQGGIASVLAASDTFESHIRDTLDAGAGLCDTEAVRVLVTEGPTHIRRLMELGAAFDQDASGSLTLGREGGHSENRIVHAKDLTGKEVEDVLLRAVRARNIEIKEYQSAVDLITCYHLEKDPYLPGVTPPGPNQCFGAYVYDRKTWEIYIIRARATILATGGAGQVYLHNTNPDVATGDGVALAYRAGAVISNMEFYQFHPTALYSPGHRTFLISEAMRGEGGILRGPDGEPFTKKYDERGDLAPRDIVARAIDAEMKRTGAAFMHLDVTHLPREQIMKKFPNIYAHCLDLGIEISRDRIPVVPAAHYMCGGVRTDVNGRTAIEHLFAVGEVSCTGVHGGNRLASNSLLEGLVFADRIGRYIKENQISGQRPEIRRWQKEGLANAEEWILVQHNLGEIKSVMWDYVGIVRSNLRLDRALRRIEMLSNEINDFYSRTVIQNKILELRNLALVGKLIVRSAKARRESRGLHFSTDYAENREPSMAYTSLQRSSAG
ncbi:MAG TPA: L-aspartate oxidase [Leptospiraceae bacterium]|nr:L-aspartate oxidase [Leptospiraceae bacterium]HMY45471.1 L-aspartate oxidase [Leptospiraceae bacterium]HMZ37695.1 L-aspartate oxidase [Leptospiraceae bacterium]HNL01138.1 L-aspartate oxidase [Leptospiraceae bacterium]